MKASAPTMRRGVQRVRSFFLFALAFAVVMTTVRAQGSAVRTETFSLRHNGEVVVENPRGATRVESWDFQTVRIVAEKKAPSGSTIAPGELVLMGAQNSILVQCKEGTGRLDLTVYVPQSALLQVSGGAWPVEIIGPLASAVVDTTSGNIGCRLPVNDDARVNLRSAKGTVRSSLSLSGIERSDTHRLQGQIGSGAAHVILASQSGNVTLTPGSAFVKASNRTAPSLATDLQTTRGGPARADSEAQPGAGNSTTDSRGSDRQDYPAAGNNNRGIATQPSQRSSIEFAGSDRSEDSSMTSTTGPLTRPRRERNTSGGSSGLNARIIPSDAPPSSQRASGAANDTTDDQEEMRGGNQPSGKAPASGRGSNSVNQNNSQNGSVGFAGSDRADVGSDKARVGPLERDRQTKNTSAGNSGLRVRIIPADTPPAPSRDSRSVFDERNDNAQTQPDNSARNTQIDPGQNTQRDDSGQQGPRTNRAGGSRANSAVDQDEVASSNSRAGAPPVLHRNRIEEPSTASEPESKPTSTEEEAIVLKAALVNLNVSVTNRSGVAMANLKREDFDVAENGEAQKIEFFQPTTAPFNLVLVLDLSGSIKDKLDVVKSAALRFLEVVGPQDKVAVVTFTDEIRVVSQLTDDRNELKRRIKLIDRSVGGTAFYEALWFSLADTLRGTRGQRNAIVVMTDGVDSSLDRYSPMQSRVSFNQLTRRLEESDVIVFPIFMDTEYEEVFERGNSSSEAYAIARDQLERIAEVSGGQIFRAEKAGDLSGVYKVVAAAIRTVYSVGYYPTNPEKDGTFRRVRVSVNRSDAAVRTRKGYYSK